MRRLRLLAAVQASSDALSCQPAAGAAPAQNGQGPVRGALELRLDQGGGRRRHAASTHAQPGWCAQASHWQQYAQLELRARNMAKVKSVFSRCLLNCYSISLWTAYLDFIKQVRSLRGPHDCAGACVRHAGCIFGMQRSGVTPGQQGPSWPPARMTGPFGLISRSTLPSPPDACTSARHPHAALLVQLNASKGPDGLREVKQAYSYTLERMGQHTGSGPLWLDYLALLRTPKPGTPAFTAMFGGPGVGPPQEGTHRTTVIRCAPAGGRGRSRHRHVVVIMLGEAAVQPSRTLPPVRVQARRRPRPSASRFGDGQAAFGTATAPGTLGQVGRCAEQHRLLLVSAWAGHKRAP